MIDVVGALPRFVPHMRITNSLKIFALGESLATLGPDRKRCTRPSDQIDQTHLFQFCVVPPERPPFGTPATEIKVSFAIAQGIENDMVHLPILPCLHAERVVVESGI